MVGVLAPRRRGDAIGIIFLFGLLLVSLAAGLDLRASAATRTLQRLIVVHERCLPAIPRGGQDSDASHRLGAGLPEFFCSHEMAEKAPLQLWEGVESPAMPVVACRLQPDSLAVPARRPIGLGFQGRAPPAGAAQA